MNMSPKFQVIPWSILQTVAYWHEAFWVWVLIHPNPKLPCRMGAILHTNLRNLADTYIHNNNMNISWKFQGLRSSMLQTDASWQEALWVWILLSRCDSFEHTRRHALKLTGNIHIIDTNISVKFLGLERTNTPRLSWIGRPYLEPHQLSLPSRLQTKLMRLRMGSIKSSKKRYSPCEYMYMRYERWKKLYFM